jgi:hypothetical protein
MIFKTIEFKREKDSKWEKGYMIEQGDNDLFLGSKLNPVIDRENDRRVWEDRYQEGFHFDFPNVY